MNIKLIIKIAKSLLLARFKQTLVAAVGVTFSISMFIALLSFMAGLNDLLDGLLLNRTPHVRLYNEIQPNSNQPIYSQFDTNNTHNFIHSIKSTVSRQEIYNSEAIMRTLKKDQRIMGIAPKIITPVFFNDGAIDITGVVNGIEIQSEGKLFHFNEYVTAGEPADIERLSNSIILGKGLADQLLANLGDVVQVATINGERFPLRVVGFFQSGMQELDKTQSYASIATVQKLKEKPNNYITDIQIKLKDLAKAPQIAKDYARLFEIDAVDIQTANASFETGSFVRTLISYAVGVVLLIVAGFGIYNILNMMIYEKMNTIAILKATGFAGKDVQKIFLVIAMSIGFFGGLAGLILGFGLSAIIDQIPFETPSLPSVNTYPVSYNPTYYVIGAVFSLITTFLAGWFPSRKASKVDPVVIIRGK
ncbi:FtsX-like permease family protein [Lacihabitans sp. CS3-21]|uniref:ABC transporter permease n=1 Tax=Lacihabitans sp. CS3-21 TaxID=2487332 RepID=UPI0020CE75C0|nr:FtsX-like permease family protein [Lacihabitans sp. CS3-21]MCP9746398.1 ABC transporter permease [Lacihabitans sp. CS3-21]